MGSTFLMEHGHEANAIARHSSKSPDVVRAAEAIVAVLCYIADRALTAYDARTKAMEREGRS